MYYCTTKRVAEVPRCEVYCNMYTPWGKAFTSIVTSVEYKYNNKKQ